MEIGRPPPPRMENSKTFNVFFLLKPSLIITNFLCLDFWPRNVWDIATSISINTMNKNIEALTKSLLG